jgi:hypothetical protein
MQLYSQPMIRLLKACYEKQQDAVWFYNNQKG